MSLPWMAWAVVVTTLVAGAARLLEAVLRGRGRATRWIWAGAMAASLALIVWPVVAPPAPPAPAASSPAGATATDPFPGLLTGLAELTGAARPRPALLERARVPVLAAWLGASALLGLSLVGGLARLAARSRRWPRARVSGSDVLLSEDFGPAVLGVRMPRLVLPRWALALPPALLRIVVLHEEEHRKAGDSALLLAGQLLATLVPWNPAAWWQLRRLRAAVELDCDARVLGRGVRPLDYARVLLDVGTRARGPVPAVATLVPTPTLLERRMTMILDPTPSRGRIRTLAATGLAAVLLAAACETPAPTAVTPAEDDAGVIEARSTLPPAGAQRVTEEVARLAESPGTPIVYLDGVRIDAGDGSPVGGVLKRIPPDAIERIEIVKGEEARARFGAEAAAGVIQVFTKAADGEAGPAGRLQRADRAARTLRELQVTEERRAREEAAARPTFQAREIDAPPTTSLDGERVAPAEGHEALLTVREHAPEDLDAAQTLREIDARRALPGDMEVFVDGERFEGRLSDLDPGDIAGIEISKATEDAARRIDIRLKPGATVPR